MKTKALNKQAGFTLLEVVIAIAILSFISLFTARMIQQGIKARAKIQDQIDRTGALSTALQLMSRDIERAFHYHDFNVELYNAAQAARKKKAQPPTPPNPPNPPNPPTPPPPDPNDPNNPDAADDKFKLKEVKTYTRFMGEKEKLNFTSLNNSRSIKNMQQSDQAEIGYFLETCSGRVKKDKTSECLWRRMSPYIDSEITEGGNKTVILENVKSLQFRYLGPGHEEEWVESWKTEGAEEVMKDNFPYAVEITLTILDQRFSPAKEIPMTVVAALKFPNNKPDTKGENEKSPATTQ